MKSFEVFRTMKNVLLAYSIFNVIFLSTQTDFHIINWERFITNDNYVHIESATVIDGNRFTVKLRTVKTIDYVGVSSFLKKNSNQYDHNFLFYRCECVSS